MCCADFVEPLPLTPAPLLPKQNSGCLHHSALYELESVHVYVQVILAVLARGYEWSVDLEETFIQTSPLPALTNGMPMKCWKRDQPMHPSSPPIPS